MAYWHSVCSTKRYNLLDKFVSSLEKHRPTFLHIAPPMVSFLATRPEVTPDHLSSVSEVLVAAAPFGEALAKKYLEKAPHTIFKEAWGMGGSSGIPSVFGYKNHVGFFGIKILQSFF